MSDHVDATASHLWLYLYLASAILTIYLTTTTIYNLHFHPLRSIPGPLSHRASPLPYILRMISGDLSFHTHRLHEKYGTVVRLAPNHLSFTDVRAWRDIYGHRVPPSSPNTPDPSHALDENPKSRTHYGFFPQIPPSILEAPREEHAVLRKALSHGFSEKALRAQEGRIKRYVDFLVLRLTQNAKRGTKALDVAKWYNWIAFDVVSDLIFAEPFGCLEMQE
jgi:cytochrome P450